MRKHVGDESVDLIYLDPLLSNVAYSGLFCKKSGKHSATSGAVPAFSCPRLSFAEDPGTGTPHREQKRMIWICIGTFSRPRPEQPSYFAGLTL